LPAIVTQSATSEYPRSYIIATPNGHTYRRNRRHLRSAPTNSARYADDDSALWQSWEKRFSRTTLATLPLLPTL